MCVLCMCVFYSKFPCLCPTRISTRTKICRYYQVTSQISYCKNNVNIVQIIIIIIIIIINMVVIVVVVVVVVITVNQIIFFPVRVSSVGTDILCYIS